MDIHTNDVHTNSQKDQQTLLENNGVEPNAGTSLPPPVSKCRDRSVSPKSRSDPPGEQAPASAPIPPIQSNLQAEATTAVSLTAIGSQSHEEGLKDDYGLSAIRSLPGNLRAKASLSQLVTPKGSEAGDTASIRSSIPNTDMGEPENLFGDFAISERGSNAQDATGLLHFPEFQGGELEDDFASEFDPIGEVDEDGSNEELLLEKWKAKRKHYIILSAAGKPIWTRHGDNGLVSTYVGIIQTILSFYENSGDRLNSFSAGDTKFVILTQGPLYLVAISRMLESDEQLKLQLEALYMQILSTLTFPSLSHLFSIRPSTDLKRPLQGSESLLSTLADSFTRGSPSTLLSAMECLKIRKSHRHTINNTLLRTRVKSLLYGLVVAGGRLVSVVRPKKHSLHPGDLQLLFNMIFEAEGVKAGGGESWIPVCLPGFNSKGYLFMYVSFLDLRGNINEVAGDTATKEESVAIILISTDRESFFDLQSMRIALVEQMEKNGSINVIRTAIEKGRPATTDIIPGTVLRHFLYKSRANVQFAMSSYDPDFSSTSRHRRLMSIYESIHASVHAKHTHVKMHCFVSQSASSFAWITPVFEFYCVAGPNANRNALAISASKIVRWVQQEEERLFIIGGAVF